MLGLFNKKKNIEREQSQFFKANFRRIMKEDRVRNKLKPKEEDFDLMLDFATNEVLNAAIIAWNRNNVLADADELELVIMAYHVWYLLSVICAKTGINKRQRSEFYKSGLVAFFTLIEKHKITPYPHVNPGNKLDPEKFAKDVEMLILRVDKIYGPDKVWQIFEENFLKCLGDLDDQSSEMVGRRSLALMMTQIHDKIAVSKI